MRFISTELTGLCHGKPTANGKNRLFHGNSLVKHNRMQLKCRWCLTWNDVCVISIRLAGPGKHQSALCGTEVNNSIVEHQHSSLIRLLDEQCNYMASFNCNEHVGFKWFYSWTNCYNQLCSYTNRKLLNFSFGWYSYMHNNRIDGYHANHDKPKYRSNFEYKIIKIKKSNFLKIIFLFGFFFKSSYSSADQKKFVSVFDVW